MLQPQVRPPFPLVWGFSTKLDGPEHLPERRLSQVHGCGIVEAPAELIEADGQWTCTRGLRIGVRVADCVPVLLAGRTDRGPWVAALHAGWRGSVAGMLRKGVAVFQSLGGEPDQLVYAFGPAIQVCHFEVGEEVVAAARQDPAWSEQLQQPGPGGRPHLDLLGFLRAQAQDLGLDPRKDGSVPLCTLCQRELLYSHRAGEAGRQWGWIEIQ